MSPTTIVLMLLAGGALVAGGVLLHDRRSIRSLTVRLQLPYAENDETLLQQGLRRITRLNSAISPQRGRERGVKARFGMHPAVVFLGAVTAIFVTVATRQVVLGLALGVALPVGATLVVRSRQRRQHDRLRQQLPQALTVLGSSLEAGAPIDRSLAILARRSPEPLSSELARLGSELSMGVDLADALERMVVRVKLDDLGWWVYAVRLQRKVGGPLAPITRTLADAMTEREELRQQVRVLTAEGRISAYVLGALPALVVVAVQLSSPGYLSPFFSGWGLVMFAGMVFSVVAGIAMVLRMVRGGDQ